MADANPAPQSLKIAPVRLRELHQLQRLFERAVRENFDYFPGDVQRRVIGDHNLRQLIKAHMDPRRVILVARHQGKVVGYCVGAVPAAGPSQLFWLYVAPQHRGTNTGLSLLSRTIRQMQEQGAQEIYLATHDHRRYYERQGFRFVRHEVQDGVEMDIMSFTIRRAA